MKTPTLFCVFLLYFSFSIYSQEYQIGVRGGISDFNVGNIRAHGFGEDPPRLYSPKQETEYHYGFYFRVELDKFIFWSELNYLKVEATYEFKKNPAKWETSKVEFPLLVGYKPFKPVTVYLGPMINFNGDTTLEGVHSSSFSDGGPNLEKTTFSFNVGILIKYDRFGIDLRYEHAMKENEEELVDIRHNIHGVNLADLKAYSPHVLSVSLLIDLYRTNPKKENGLLSNLFNKKTKCGCLFN